MRIKIKKIFGMVVKIIIAFCITFVINRASPKTALALIGIFLMVYGIEGYYIWDLKNDGWHFTIYSDSNGGGFLETVFSFLIMLATPFLVFAFIFYIIGLIVPENMADAACIIFSSVIGIGFMISDIVGIINAFKNPALAEESELHISIVPDNDDDF